jgi:ribosome-associated protein
MIEIARGIAIDEREIVFVAIRAQGAGGQNVNKVSNAVHLRFDIHASSLPAEVKAALAALRDQRISDTGVVVIKAQRFRSLEKNRADAVERLCELLRRAAARPAARIATKPSRAARARRVDTKSRRGRTKALRGRVDPSG